MMTKRICAALCALSAFPAAAIAAPATGDAQIAVVTPLSFIQVEDMHFGQIIPTTVAGTVTVATGNVLTTTNGIVSIGNSHQVAKFAGMGTQNQNVTIQLTPTTINLTGPGPSMAVTGLVIAPEATLQDQGGGNFQILPADGIFWFVVGGTLNVAANQPPGSYSGTFAATLEYQ